MADSEEKKDDTATTPPAAPTKEEEKAPESADTKPSEDAAADAKPSTDAAADAKPTADAEEGKEEEEEETDEKRVNKEDQLVFNFFKSPINNDIVLSTVHRNKTIKNVIDEIEAGLYLAGDFYGNANGSDNEENEKNWTKTESLSKYKK